MSGTVRVAFVEGSVGTVKVRPGSDKDNTKLVPGHRKLDQKNGQTNPNVPFTQHSD